MARSSVSPCVFIETTLKSLVSAQASRQVIAASVAALWRLNIESSHTLAIDLEVEDRLGSVRGALREQLLERN
eukprot:407123-Prorocentrum_lima.AAC.1